MSDSDKTILGMLETVKHIHQVRAYLYQMIEELDRRARKHDLSKLESPEKEIFGGRQQGFPLSVTPLPRTM